MNNKKVNIIGAIAAVALLGVAWLLFVPANSPTEVTPTPIAGNTATNGTQANLPNATNYDYLVARLALGFGTNTSNVNMLAQRMTLVSGTSTPCAIQNPFNATSTVLTVSMNITTATSSAISWAVGSSTTAFATSSNMESIAVAAGSQYTLTWDPGNNNAVLAPRAWIVIGADTATLPGTGAFNSIILAGSCQATFVSAT